MLGPVLGGSLAYIHPVSAPLMAVIFLYAFVFALVLIWYKKLILDGSNATKSEHTSTQERRKKSV